MTTGDEWYGGELSYLPGQRLSACTCPGEPHPGPQNRDGTFVGRSAPEIDVLEAQVSEADRIGHVSQSVCPLLSVQRLVLTLIRGSIRSI